MNVREELKAYYDNELAPAQAEEVRHLLEADPSLSAEYEEIASLSQSIRTREVRPVPYGIENTLGALVANRRRSRPRRIFELVLATGLAAIVMAVFFPVFAQSKAAAKHYSMATGASAASSEGMVSQMKMARSPVAADGLSDRATNGFRGPTSRQPVGRMEAQKQVFAREVQTSEAQAAPKPAVQANTLVVKNGQMQLQVDSVDDAQQSVEVIAKGAGGFVESANRQDFGQVANVDMTLRVPVSRFETVLRDVRKLGKVLTQSFGGEDVTAQVVDTDARLRTLRSEEQQYVTLMSRANKIGEVLAVKERITAVREEIESLDAQQRSLRNQARMSTLQLGIRQKPKAAAPPAKHAERTWSENAWARAIGRLTDIGTGLGTFGIYVLVFSPVMLPLGLIGWMAYRKYRW